MTALTSMEIWTNSRIHCHDHAFLLYSFGRGARKMWMLHDPELPFLGSLLAASFPLTLTGCALLCLVWAASMSLRFGPQPILEAGERRQLLEHLQATADFWWRGALLQSPLLNQQRRPTPERERAQARLKGNFLKLLASKILPYDASAD